MAAIRDDGIPDFRSDQVAVSRGCRYGDEPAGRGVIRPDEDPNHVRSPLTLNIGCHIDHQLLIAPLVVRDVCRVESPLSPVQLCSKVGLCLSQDLVQEGGPDRIQGCCHEDDADQQRRNRRQKDHAYLQRAPDRFLEPAQELPDCRGALGLGASAHDPGCSAAYL